MDLALLRVGYLIASLLLILLIQSTAANNPFPVGPAVYWSNSYLGVMFAALLAIRLAGDSAGDVRTGLAEMLFLTGFKPRQWLVTRLVQVWSGFLSAWIVRIPLLLFTFTLGGITLEQIVLTELLIVNVFALFSSLGLLFSFTSTTRGQVFGLTIVTVIVLEVLLITPSFAASLLAAFINIPISTGMQTIVDIIASIGLIARLSSVTSLSLTAADCWPTFVLYAALAAAAIVWLRRLFVLVSLGNSAASGETSLEPARPRDLRPRESRRCWDDALAWQAFRIHSDGTLVVRTKCVAAILLATLLLIAEQFPQLQELTFIIVTISAAMMLLLSTAKPSDCLQREIRGKTLPMLLLTPHNANQLYAGWRRGAWRLAWPDLLLGLVVVIYALQINPVAPLVAITIAIALASAGPFLMLSPLVPFSVSGFASAAALIITIILIISAAVFCGVATHPAVIPLVLLPLAFAFNQFIRRVLLPYWLRKKIVSLD